jgi:PhzF family phenazine biosynthesis protein
MLTVRFKQVDVFTQKSFLGNPAAVILDGESLNVEQMQRIAAWTNISETTFVLPPSTDGADYRLRIFTPKQELPFAGHPTIGSAHAVLESGFAAARRGKLRQQCLAGVIDIKIEKTPRW